MVMTAGYRQETHWQRAAYAQLMQSRSPEEVECDNKVLREIFNQAAEVPLLAEALDWAKKHDIQFYIDPNTVNLGGYYVPNAGVVVLDRKFVKNKKFAVGVLVHEIRHAWQDYHGLCKGSDYAFNRYFLREALIEADALAYGLRAEDQYRAARARKSHWPWQRWRASSMVSKDENADLGKKFLSWFSRPSRTRFYGDYASKLFGQFYRLFPVDEKKPEGGLPERRYSVKSDPPPEVKKIDIDNIQDVLRLGQSFSGARNYLAALQPDILPRKILRPTLADEFWGAASKKQRKLTAALRKAALKQKLAPQYKIPPHPWP